MAIFSRKSRVFLLAATLATLAAPAAYAQFSDSYNFLKAVKDRKGEDAEKFINEPGSGSRTGWCGCPWGSRIPTT